MHTEPSCSWQVAKSAAGGQGIWALARRRETTLKVMDVITQTFPPASAEVPEVVGPTAGRKYATELLGTFLFLFTIAAPSSAPAPWPRWPSGQS